MTKRKKSNPLPTQLALAFIAVAASWILLSEEEDLILAHLVILAYVVYAIVKQLVLSRKNKQQVTKKK